MKKVHDTCSFPCLIHGIDTVITTKKTANTMEITQDQQKLWRSGSACINESTMKNSVNKRVVQSSSSWPKPASGDGWDIWWREWGTYIFSCLLWIICISICCSHLWRKFELTKILAYQFDKDISLPKISLTVEAHSVLKWHKSDATSYRRLVLFKRRTGIQNKI